MYLEGHSSSCLDTVNPDIVHEIYGSINLEGWNVRSENPVGGRPLSHIDVERSPLAPFAEV